MARQRRTRADLCENVIAGVLREYRERGGVTPPTPYEIFAGRRIT